jgi:hypothetical protein
MSSKRISDSLFDGTANLFALMFLARLQLSAGLLALEVLSLFYFFRGHQSQFQMLRVVKLVTRYHSAVFAALADLLYKYLALMAILIVASLSALMAMAGQELFTSALTDGDLVSAFSSFLAEQSDYLSATAWTVLDLGRGLLAWLASALMTDLLAGMLPTVQSLTAYVVTHESFASTLD